MRSQQGLRSGKAGNPQPHYRGNFHVCLLVVGALAGKTCNCSLAVAFESNGESVMLIDKINAIFPNLLSLGVVFLLFWLMKYKKVSSIKIVFGVLIGVALLSLVGIV